jgi:hypothetical protein
MTTENTTRNTTTEQTSEALSTESKPQSLQPERTFRNGAIAASVWRRQTGTGSVYFDFSLSRSWKSKTSDKEGYSTSFFPRNAEALTDVIQRASDWIIEQMASRTDLAESANSDADGAEGACG